MTTDLLAKVFTSLLATMAVSGCDGDGGSDVVDARVEVDVSETDAPDTDTLDTADTLDATDALDATDVLDTTDTRDTAETADTDDTRDSVDTTDSEVVTHTCEVPLEPGDPDFNDHTLARIPSVDCFFSYAGSFEHDPVLLKFVISDLNAGAPADAALFFYDNGFYQLHDEWYWFRLLNGHTIPGLATPQPVTGPSFATIAAIYQAYAGATNLPLDLAFLGTGTGFDGRLYSPNFYALVGFNKPLAERFFSLGTLVHFAPEPQRAHPEEVWAFEFEYTDQPTVAYLERTLAVLEARLPAELTGKVFWLARSAPQEALAAQLRQAGHALGARTLTYDDLVVDGAVEVYNEGIAAGRIHILDTDFSPNDVQNDELAIIPRVPDDIPPSRAIISAVPQTALAHVNLLAKSRGTPNVYVGGILSWGQLAEWDWSGQKVIVEATAAHGVRWRPIIKEKYDTYIAMQAPPIRHVQQIPDIALMPLTVSLTEGGIDALEALVPLAGGKCAGFLSFLEVPSMNTPDAPLAITIKPFIEHQAEFLPLLTAALADPDFVADSRVRFLVLEGEDAYREENANNPAALVLVEEIKASHNGDVIDEIIGLGGARQVLIDKPMKYETLRDLRAALTERFGFLARTQGLRFRSSSTAEDVPGFNGAGLYVSNTGYLYAGELTDPTDRVKTVELAIKQTWGSYWGFQAFEERRAGRINHFEGNMAVAVHPRFDNDKELANAVATFWRSDYPTEPVRHLVMNVQKGALAVTNPGGTLELPEIDEVVLVAGVPEVRRVQRSTVAEPDEWLFTDEELLGLYAQADEHSAKWLAMQGEGVPLSERPKTLVLDYELKHVRPGWPAMASGEVRPERIIWRQSRVLDQVVKVPTTMTDPWNGSSLPVATYLPKDLRTVARSLIADRCDSEWADIRVYKVFTEASTSELFPYFASPFIYKVVIDFKKAPPGLSPSLSNWLIQWTNLSERSFGATGTRVTVNPGIAQTLGIDGFELSPVPDGTFRVWKGDVEFTGNCTARKTEQPYKSAADYLRGLLDAP